MYRAVLFDLGDTLLDFEPMDTRALFKMAARHGYEHLRARGASLPAFERYFRAQYRALRWAYFWAKLRGREFDSTELLRRSCARFGCPADDATLSELSWLWYRPLVEHSSVAADVTPTLAALCEAGLRLGIVSNTFIPGATIDRHLDLVGLKDFFAVRVYSSDIGCRKPHRRIFQEALRQLGVTAHAALFVGDLLKTDIVGAKRIGMRTVWRCPWSNCGPHRVADHTIRRISELVPIVFQQPPGALSELAATNCTHQPSETNGNPAAVVD
jgi:putative hydrolase of the HAD superfamily